MTEPKENSLLIAEPFLKDKDFIRSVVFLCRHSDEGSFGFILNKLFDQTLDELFDELDGFPVPVYVGGPVEQDTIHFLHQYPDLIPGHFQLTDDIYWGGDFLTVCELIKNNQVDQRKIKFFIGYSGWNVNQLQDELKEKSWLTGQATKRIVFDLPADEIWKESIKQLGGDFEMMINFPIDPQLN